MHNLIVFASGRGSNAEAIIRYFGERGGARVSLVVCNKQGAGVLELAAREGIETLVVDRAAFASDDFAAHLQAHSPSMLVLAGFLWKIPEAVVEAFADRIINVHPALLPKHGGKGMWGRYVHEAVLAAGDRESGITIHRVNEHYDEGGIVLQARCPVFDDDTAETLAERVQALEHFFLPRTIDFLLAETG